MPSYEYAGQHPVPDGRGGVIRPGDVVDTLPDFGPFTELPESPQEPSEAQGAPVPATGRDKPVTASTAAPAARTDPEA